MLANIPFDVLSMIIFMAGLLPIDEYLVFHRFLYLPKRTITMSNYGLCFPYHNKMTMYKDIVHAISKSIVVRDGLLSNSYMMIPRVITTFMEFFNVLVSEDMLRDMISKNVIQITFTDCVFTKMTPFVNMRKSLRLIALDCYFWDPISFHFETGKTVTFSKLQDYYACVTFEA
jgi:hypothetical protein